MARFLLFVWAKLWGFLPFKVLPCKSARTDIDPLGALDEQEVSFPPCWAEGAPQSVNTGDVYGLREDLIFSRMRVDSGAVEYRIYNTTTGVNFRVSEALFKHLFVKAFKEHPRV